MRVLFDHIIFSWQKYGGVSKYFTELILGLRAAEVECTLPVYITRNCYLKSISKKHLKIDDWKGSYQLIQLINKPCSLYHISRQNYNLFHPTSTNPYFLRQVKNKPFVVTVHDLTVELFPQYFTYPSYVDKTIEGRKQVYEKAAKIIAISENTKKDLINFYGVPADKIDVIYHGYSQQESATERQRDFHLQKDSYLLYVGSRAGYKNFQNFLLAAAQFTQHNLQIVCVGGGPFTSNESAIIKKLGIKNCILQMDVNDIELDWMYKNAALFIYPSLYEGFGMPILESFANNCPVALSAIDVFFEVAGNAAVYFDPHSPESITSAITTVIFDGSKKAEMKENGRQVLKRFSWKSTALNTINTYASAINEC